MLVCELCLNTPSLAELSESSLWLCPLILVSWCLTFSTQSSFLSIDNCLIPVGLFLWELFSGCCVPLLEADFFFMFSPLGEFCISFSKHFLGTLQRWLIWFCSSGAAFYGIRSFILGFIFLWAIEAFSFFVVDTFIWYIHKMDWRYKIIST